MPNVKIKASKASGNIFSICSVKRLCIWQKKIKNGAQKREETPPPQMNSSQDTETKSDQAS